jgi:hypothetical protein
MGAAKVLLSAALVVGVLFAAGAALGANAPIMAGGAVQLWVTPSPTGNGKGGRVLITGVIGDYGKARNATPAGKPTAKTSPYKDLLLKHGTILIDLTRYQKAENDANPTMYNKTNCQIARRTSSFRRQSRF